MENVPNNRLCELLGIHYPVIQAPMNWVSGADLAAAVSKAGGLGTIGPNGGEKTITSDVEETAERLRSHIRRVKSLTDRPFAINVSVGVGGGQRFSQRIVEMVIDEGVPVVISSVGSPDVYTKVLKDAGIKVLHAISTVRHAKRAEEVGVDGVICEGYEGGGHKGFTELTTLVLVPMVAAAVKIPVVAGGGIADARGVVAALALGADGVYMGTRFLVAHESASHPNVKEALIQAEDVCTVSVPKEAMLGRDLRNQFTQKFLEMRAAGAPPNELSNFLNQHGQYQAQALGDAEGAEVCCGQAAGLIRRRESAAEIIDGIANGIPFALEALQHRLSAFS